MLWTLEGAYLRCCGSMLGAGRWRMAYTIRGEVDESLRGGMKSSPKIASAADR